jgi:predicted dienelactone hydrolase
MTRSLLSLLVLLFGVACGPGDGAPGDDAGGSSDAGAVAADAGALDAGVVDAGAPDAGVVDGGAADAGAADGGAADAGAVDAGNGGSGENLAERGPLSFTATTTTVTRSGRSIPVRALVPAGAAGAPLLVFAPGFQLQADFYAPFLEHLASHGFVTVGADPPASLLTSVDHVAMAEDLGAVITWALEELGAAVDPARIATLGHSLGGKVAVMAAHRDERVAAVFTLDPVNGGGPSGYSDTRPDIVPTEVASLAIPLGFVGEKTNATGSLFRPACAPADQNFETFFQAADASPRAYQWEILGADHMDFVDDCGFRCGLCKEGTADAADVLALTRTLALAFFKRHLLNEAAYEAWLSGAAVPNGVVAARKP